MSDLLAMLNNLYSPMTELNVVKARIIQNKPAEVWREC